MSHSVSDLLAFLSLGLGISAAFGIPLAWVDADYLLLPDWQPLGDRLLVESRRAVDSARAVQRRAAVTAAALLLLLTPAALEGNR